MTPPTKSRVRLRPDARRDQLLTIGAQLLAERHLDEVQITEIADRAGVSRGLLYHYFPTKQDFAIAVARSACEEVFVAEPDPALPVDERARWVLDAYVEFAEANQDAYRAMHISLVADPRVRELRAADLAGHEQRVLGAFGIAEPSPILRAAIRGWLAFVIAVILDWLADRGGMSREDVVELCTRTLVDVVGRYVSADGWADPVLRPASWSTPAGGRPVRVGTGAPGSRPSSPSRGGGSSGASAAPAKPPR